MKDDIAFKIVEVIFSGSRESIVGILILVCGLLISCIWFMYKHIVKKDDTIKELTKTIMDQNNHASKIQENLNKLVLDTIVANTAVLESTKNIINEVRNSVQLLITTSTRMKD